MKTLTVTAARKRFGAMLDAIQAGPIQISRRSRAECVIVSVEEFGTPGNRGALNNLA